jgi:hypothetical protein
MARKPMPTLPPKTKGVVLRYVQLPTRAEDGCRAMVVELAGMLSRREGRAVTGPEAVRVALEEAIKRRTPR